MRYLLLLIFIFFISCSSRKKKVNSKYFEGFVEFQIEVHSNSPAKDSADLVKYGRYFITYIKDSAVARYFYNDNNVIESRQVFRSDSLKLYTYHENSDTMYITDLSTDVSNKNLSQKELPGTTILGKKTLRLDLLNELRETLFSDPVRSTTTYYLDTSILIPPYIHSGVTYGSYGKIFSKYNFLTVGFDTNLGETRFIATARRIVHGHVNPIYFDIPNKRVRINSYLR